MFSADSTTAPACSLLVNALQAEDDGNDIHIIANLKRTSNQLLQEKRFADLDCVADYYRSHKAKFPSGRWRLHTVYSGVDEPLLHPTEEDWQHHLELVQEWVSERPNSITARVALAKSYTGYAWAARGNGWSSSVSESGWRLFGEQLQKAKDTLDEAAKLPAKCPEWYASMQQIALGQEWPVPAAQKLFAQATAFEPDYDLYYRMYAEYISPKWNGEEGDSEKFIEEATNKIGGAAGDALYYQIAANVGCGCLDDEVVKHMSWDRIQKGFTYLEKQYGPSFTNMNLMAFMAGSRPDALLADKLVKRIGENRDDDLWSQRNFDNVKKWAADMAPALQWQKNVDDAVKANMESREGSRYAKLAGSKLSDLLQGCSDPTGKDPNFTLRILVLKDGATGRAFASGEFSPVTNCLFKKLGEIKLANGRPFAPPPKPDYWLEFAINPRDTHVKISEQPMLN
jgi:hypothetical protein